MDFIHANQLLQERFFQLEKEATHLFEIDVDKEELWNLYLDSFPAGTNEIFRERRSHDCSCCRHFVRSIGNAVFIINNQPITLWDVETGDTTYQPVFQVMSQYLKSRAVSDVWVTKTAYIGTASNLETTDNGILKWDHFHLELPSKFVDKSSESEESIKGRIKTKRNVFARSLNEISEDALLTVLELIDQNDLYKGEEWKTVLQKFLVYKREYSQLQTTTDKHNYAWAQSVLATGSVGELRNVSMGTLLLNISEGMELNEAIQKYMKIVDPTNYKRVKAVHTEKMRESAKKALKEMGYMEEGASSLERKFASLKDITVNNVLFSNKSISPQVGEMDVFEELASEEAINPKRFSKVEKVTMEHFLSDICPQAKEISLFLENQHFPNMMSLIAPEHKKSKSMLKWQNGFSWSYTGNITDSKMKDNVKAAGGKVDGVLRFSIQWNDEKPNNNDLDAHCIEPDGYEIYFGNRERLSPTGGSLDVDIIRPLPGVPAVENITWANTDNMVPGDYQFIVENYNHKGGIGVNAEIEFRGGPIHSYAYKKEILDGKQVHVATVHYDGENFTLKENLPSTSTVSSKEVWGLKTNQFVPVTVMMHSPNYWEDEQGVGNKHYFFMLKDCLNPETPSGFYNEFLKEELRPHRQVLEALGGKMRVKDTEEQLSGVGFSSTQRNEVVLKVVGETERIVKVTF